MRADLDAYLQQHAAFPFDWRTHNCAHFAAGWVLAKTGRDVLAAWHAWMPHTRHALRQLARAGGYTDAATQALGPPIGGPYACRGDVVLLLTPKAQILRRRGERKRYTGMGWGICTGSHIAALSTQGIVMLPLTAGRLAWRV